MLHFEFKIRHNTLDLIVLKCVEFIVVWTDEVLRTFFLRRSTVYWHGVNGVVQSVYTIFVIYTQFKTWDNFQVLK